MIDYEERKAQLRRNPDLAAGIEGELLAELKTEQFKRRDLETLLKNEAAECKRLATELARVEAERDELRHWKTEAMMVLAQTHDAREGLANLGETVADTLLRLARERDAAIARAEKAEAERDEWKERAFSAEALLCEADSEIRQLNQEIEIDCQTRDERDAARAEADTLKVQLADVRAEVDGLDCTRREGGDTRHCRVESPCLRCRLEAEAKRLMEALRDTRQCLAENEDPDTAALRIIDAALAAPEVKTRPTTVCPECGVRPGHDWCGRVGGPVTPEVKP